MLGGDSAICTGSDGYLVLPISIDHDQRRAGRFIIEQGDPTGIDVIVCQFGECTLARIVCAHGTYQ
jgi:hypothetical protein